MDPGGTLHIDGQIINLTHETQIIPDIEASLRDISEGEIEQWYIDIPEATVAAEGNIPFNAEYKPADKSAHHLNLHFVMKRKGEGSKTVSEGGDNTPVPPAGDHADPNDDAAHSRSPEDVSAQPPTEPSHSTPEPDHSAPPDPLKAAPADQNAEAHH
jgi:hypothetical protein